MKSTTGLLLGAALVAICTALYLGTAHHREAGAASTLIGSNSAPRTGMEVLELSLVEGEASEGRAAQDTRSQDAVEARDGVLPSCTLIVTDPAGSPIAGARARLLPEGAGDLIVTNTRGRALLPEAFTRGTCEFEVSAGGYQSETLSAGPTASEEIRVVLWVRPTIVGHVVDASDQPVAGAIVHAVPQGVVASLDSAPIGLEGELGILLAETDSEGGFRIPAEPGVSYDLVASLPGQLSGDEARGVQVGGDPATLAILPVYGLAIRLLDPDGQVPEHLGARGPIVGQTRSKDPVARPLKHSASQLYAIRYWSQSSPLPEDTIVRLFTTQESRPSIGPVQFSREYAGYQPIDLELDAVTCAGGLTQTTIHLEPTAAQFGEIEVRFEGDEGRLGLAHSAGEKVGKLMLRPINGGDTLRFMVEWPSRGSSLLEGVPAGDYEFSFRSRVGQFLFPSGGRGQEARVAVSGQRTSVTIDCTRSGGVSFACPGEATSTIQLSLGRLSQAADSIKSLDQVQVLGTEYVHLRGTELNVPLVSAGDYLIYIEQSGVTVEGREWAAFPVRAGGLSEISLSRQ